MLQKKLEALLTRGTEAEQLSTGCVATALGVLLPALGAVGSAVAYDALGPIPFVLGIGTGAASLLAFVEGVHVAQEKMTRVYNDILVLRDRILETEGPVGKGGVAGPAGGNGRIETERLTRHE